MNKKLFSKVFYNNHKKWDIGDNDYMKKQISQYNAACKTDIAVYWHDNQSNQNVLYFDTGDSAVTFYELLINNVESGINEDLYCFICIYDRPKDCYVLYMRLSDKLWQTFKTKMID